MNMRKYLQLNKDGAEGKFAVIGTDESVDRDGDIVRVAGVDLKKFEENPVVLFGHKWNSYPIGKIGKMKKDGDKIIFSDIEFAETEEGQKVKYLVENDYLRTVSIGFIPKKSIWLDENGKKALKELDGEWYKKNMSKLNKARRVIWESEIFELSFVPIPANTNAQVVMAGKGFDYMCAFKDVSMTEEEDNDILIEIPLEEVKNAVSFNAHRNYGKADIDTAWDAKKAVTQLRKWASSDGSGDKDKIDWNKYRKGFAWYDANAPDEFGSYKLPHHYVVDGKLVVVWRGVATAMASLLGARGGVDIPADDKKGVYNHLKKHYADFDKEAPELREYSIDDIFEMDEEFAKDYFDIDDIIKFAKSLNDKLKKSNDEIEHLKQMYNNKDEATPSKKDADDTSGDEKVFEIEGLSIDELKALMNGITIKTLKGE